MRSTETSFAYVTSIAMQLKRTRCSLLVSHQLPKSDAMIKGWRKHLILNWQTKLLFYDLSSESDQKSVWSPPSLIVDLTDREFEASAVTRTEAIHAKNKDLPNMFKVEIVVSSRVSVMFHTLRSFISDLPDQSLVAKTREKCLYSDRE